MLSRNNTRETTLKSSPYDDLENSIILIVGPKHSPSPTLYNVILGLHLPGDKILIKALIIDFKFQHNIHFAERGNVQHEDYIYKHFHIEKKSLKQLSFLL